MNWLNENLKNEIKKVFEPRYDRKLNNVEVENIARSLVFIVERYIKNKKWK